MPRGGKRPGAGAPKGNLNGLKHGKTSRQFHRLLGILGDDPEAMRLVRLIVRGDEARKKRHRREAAHIVGELLARLEHDRNDSIAEAYERRRALSILDELRGDD